MVVMPLCVAATAATNSETSPIVSDPPAAALTAHTRPAPETTVADSAKTACTATVRRSTARFSALIDCRSARIRA